MKIKSDKDINEYHCDHIDVIIVSIARWNFKFARHQFSSRSLVRLWIILQWTGTRFRRRASVLSSNSKPLWGDLISLCFNVAFHKSDCRPTQRYRRTKTRIDRARVRTNRETSQMEYEILGCRGGTIDCRGGARYYRLTMTSEPLKCVKLGANLLLGISTSIMKEYCE